MNLNSENGLAGSTINGYHLLSEIGRGNNGVVYLARQQILDRDVACKFLLPEHAAEPGYIESFLREARTAAKLTHINVVQALDVGVADDAYFFVMEYVDGDSLEYLRVHHPETITTRDLLAWSIQLADALEFAWSRHKMTHGDIKPENLMIRRSDRTLKLADLGLARISGKADHDSIMATPLYVAPEVIRQDGTPPNPGSDIYSFGVMLYELLCGVAPFDGQLEALLQRHLYEKPKPLLERNPDLDIELASFIDTMLAKEMTDRPQSWKAVSETLQKIYLRLFPKISAEPSQSAPAQQPMMIDMKHGKHRPLSGLGKFLLFIIGAAVLLASMALLFFF